MKRCYLLFFSFLFVLNVTAQVKNSVSVGAGITYPLFLDNYDISWFTALHWNIGLSRSSYIDSHFDILEIGVKDYADAPGVENDHNIYQLGVGFRQLVTKSLFLRGGASAAIINDGEATLQILPDIGIGYDFPISKKHGLEVSLKNSFIRHFNNRSNIFISSFGIAYKFWYP
jgi:hypothetical protein